MCVIRLSRTKANLFINDSIDDMFVSYVQKTNLDHEFVFWTFENYILFPRRIFNFLTHFLFQVKWH